VKLAILLLSIAFSSVSLKAQTYNYRHYTLESGLASSTVYVAYQDSKGYMWLGTENGVNRFDGKNFELFTIENGLADNDVLRIIEDSSGRIWFLTANGHLSFYLNGIIHNELTDPFLKQGYCGSGMNYVFEDSKHRIWFSTYIGRVSLLEGNEFIQLSSPFTFPDVGICTDEDEKGNIFLFSGKRKYFYDETNKSIQYHSLIPEANHASYFKSHSGANYFISTKSIYSIRSGIVKRVDQIKDADVIPKNLFTVTDDKNGNFYLCSKNGVKSINHKSARVYLEDKWVNSVTIDSEENIWFLTRGSGIYILPGQYRNNQIYGASAIGSDDINSLFLDEKRNLWIGCSDIRLSMLNKDTIITRALPVNPFQKGVIRQIISLQPGVIWCSSDANLYKILLDKKNCTAEKIIKVDPIQRIMNITFNSRGNAIVATPFVLARVIQNKDKSHLLPLENQAKEARIYYAYYDFDDNLYFSNTYGLNLFSNEGVINFRKVNPLLGEKIICITQASDSTLLLATDGHGLIFFRDNKVINHINSANGLPSGICRNVYSKGEKIFVSTNKGLAVFSYRKNRVDELIVYNSSNALPSDDVRTVAVSDDFIYVGTSKGVSLLKVKGPNSQGEVPPLYITSVLGNQGNINWQSEFEIPYYNNDLTVKYSAVTFSSPSELTYEYSLDHDEINWKSIRTNEINFPNISPGNYNFLLRAKKNNSTWTKPLSFSFIVKPPFYGTWWFIIIAALLFFGGLTIVVIYLNRRRMRVQFLILEKRNALNIERNRISADMHDDLGGDLSRIAVITEIIKMNNAATDDLKNHLHKISEFVTVARKKMDDIIWALNPSNDSLKSLAAYINLYCLNYFEQSGIKPEIIINIPEQDILLNARQRRNLFLIIKEICSNVIKHSDADVFYLEFKYFSDSILIIIRDNGKGFDPAADRQFNYGLKNITARIAEINGTFNLITSTGNGTEYVIALKLAPGF
jgi:signal transduction histidine kinase/ligand-binding sensor domain-containing protein